MNRSRLAINKLLSQKHMLSTSSHCCLLKLLHVFGDHSFDPFYLVWGGSASLPPQPYTIHCTLPIPPGNPSPVLPRRSFCGATLPPDSSTSQGCYFFIHSNILGSGTIGTKAQPPLKSSPTQRCFYHRISPDLSHWRSQPCKLPVNTKLSHLQHFSCAPESSGRCQQLVPINLHPQGSALPFRWGGTAGSGIISDSVTGGMGCSKSALTERETLPRGSIYSLHPFLLIQDPTELKSEEFLSVKSWKEEFTLSDALGHSVQPQLCPPQARHPGMGWEVQNPPCIPYSRHGDS